MGCREGEASPRTVRSYHAQVRQVADWRDEDGIDPSVGTIGVKLSVAYLLESLDNKATDGGGSFRTYVQMSS